MKAPENPSAAHPAAAGLAALRQRVAAEPDDIEARERLAEVLLELGESAEGLEQLFAAADRLGRRGDLRGAIERLHRLLDESPEHQPARRLLADLFGRVPRQAPRRPGRGPERSVVEAPDELGDQLFGLPPESARLLARILPFDEEDPRLVAGPIVVPLPPGPAESAHPFLSALDKELRRSRGAPFERRPDDPRDPRLSGDHPSAVKGRPEPEPPAPRPGGPEVRVSPASRAISAEALPPNPIIDMLDSERLSRLLDRVDLVRCAAGETVFDAWTPRGLYILVSGELRVARERPGEGRQVVDVLRPGDHFGEFELLTVMATSAQIVAAEPASVLCLDERLVSEMADAMPEIVDLLWDSYFHRCFHSVMATSPVFRSLPVDVVQRIAAELEPLVYETGDIVLREGQPPRGLYGVVGGSLAVVRPSQTAARVVTRLGPGDFFGLVSSASGEPSRASVVAAEDTTLLWLPRHALLALEESAPAVGRVLREASRDRVWRYKLAAVE